MRTKKKRLIINIIFYAFIALSYGFVIFVIVTKFNGGIIYLFGNRFDIVLTDSMSEKNQEYIDFLEGTTQIQVNDVVVSSKINDDTELFVKDVVLFKNRELHDETVMHRIVNITTEGNRFTINGATLKEYQSIKGIDLLASSSSITLVVLDITDIELEVVSEKEYNNYYAFDVSGQYVTTTVTSTKYDNYYLSNVKYTKEGTRPIHSQIFKTNRRDINYVTKVTYTRSTGEKLIFEANEFDETSEGEYVKLFNAYNLYEIRADKSNTSDGIYTKDKLISRVFVVIPQAGLFVRYITSVPGIIMIVGIALLVTGGSYVYNKLEDKKRKQNELNGIDSLDNKNEKTDK